MFRERRQLERMWDMGSKEEEEEEIPIKQIQSYKNTIRNLQVNDVE